MAKRNLIIILMVMCAVAMQAVVADTTLLRFGPNYLEGWTYHRDNAQLTRMDVLLNHITLFTSIDDVQYSLESPQFNCQGIDSLLVEIDYKLDVGYDATKVAPQVDLLDADGTVVSTVTGSVEATNISQTITVTLPVSIAGEASLLFSAPSALESEGTFPAVKGIKVWVLFHDVTRQSVDVNNDGMVDLVDINAVINVMLGKGSISQSAADVNDDGTVDIFDVNEVVNVMLGKSILTTTYTVNGVSFKMVAVEGGTFTMGATAEQGSDAYDEEKPAHQVTLSDYSIGQTEVTQELWQAVMGSNPSYFQASTNANYGSNLQRPVERVSWDDCQTFITRLNQMTGKNFRLPTEAEWEYAARGGNRSRGYKYAGSNTLADVAWYTSNSGSTTHPVATKSPNELGLYDMSGNVYEWCQDWYGSYNSDAQTNPTGPASGYHGISRGGACGGSSRHCRVSNRFYYTKSGILGDLGLRLAL